MTTVSLNTSTGTPLGIAWPQDLVAAFCVKWNVRRLAVFGSVLRSDFGPESDVDVLVDFDRGAQFGLWDVIAAEEELVAILGRPVDLVERSSVEQSENWIRRRSILDSAKIVYER